MEVGKEGRARKGTERDLLIMTYFQGRGKEKGKGKEYEGLLGEQGEGKEGNKARGGRGRGRKGMLIAGFAGKGQRKGGERGRGRRRNEGGGKSTWKGKGKGQRKGEQRMERKGGVWFLGEERKGMGRKEKGYLLFFFFTLLFTHSRTFFFREEKERRKYGKRTKKGGEGDFQRVGHGDEMERKTYLLFFSFFLFSSRYFSPFPDSLFISLVAFRGGEEEGGGKERKRCLLFVFLNLITVV